MIINFFALENLLVFLIIGCIGIFVEGLSYFLTKRKLDIYKLKSIDLAPDGFIASYNNSLNQKIFYNDILRLSYSGYNPLTRVSIWHLHYIIEYNNPEGEKKELLIPLDISGLPELLKIIIEKSGLVKIRSSQFSFVYEWIKLIAEKKPEVVESSGLSTYVTDPNESLSNFFRNSEKKHWQEVSLPTVVLVLAIFVIFLYIELDMLEYFKNDKVIKISQPQVSITPEPTITPLLSPDNIAAWQTYRNYEYGFEFKYPENWIIDKNLSNDSTNKLIGIISPESLRIQKRQMADGQFRGKYTMEDLDVYYYPSIENAAQFYGVNAKTLDEFINNNMLSYQFEKIGELSVGSAKGVDVYVTGEGLVYEIFIEKNNHVYQITFGNIGNKDDLRVIEKQILSTFKFLN